jgi:hypothetical protein
LNFGIVKRPESAPSSEPSSEQQTVVEKETKKPATTQNDDSTAVQTLESKGYKWVQWTGKLDADQVHVGTFDVIEGAGGNYALVFDNTFSKQASKSATIVLMTYPTSAPPTSGHHLHFAHPSASISAIDIPKSSPAIGPAASTESLQHDAHSLRSVAADPRPRSKHAVEIKSFGGSTFYTGIMLKKRLKHNSYAKRFFSLDFATGTLSYYQNRHSSALRGAIPLSLAVISTTESSREISVDSGAETWHLRLKTTKDYQGWRDALDRATAVAVNNSSSTKTDAPSNPMPVVSAAFIRDWERIEVLVSKISGIRDAVRRLAKDTDPKYLPSSAFGGRSAGVSPVRSPSEGSFDFSAKDEEQSERRPFWKRKASGTNPSTSSMLARNNSASRIPQQNAIPVPVPNGRLSSFPGKQYLSTSPDTSELHNINNIHNHCMEILKDLDDTVTGFSALVVDSRQRRQQSRTVTRKTSRASVSDDEFYDAHDGTSRSQLLVIAGNGPDSDDAESFLDVASVSSNDGDGENVPAFSRRRTMEEDNALFPPQPKSLAPLPLTAVKRRTQIEPPRQAPPSLVAFLRKNVGKDFANIAMPASANEPTSGLQRIAEQLEYSELIDAAASDTDPIMRLLHITAFAVSSFSNNRVKERAARKPFNPMLGETFELVREDKSFRLIAEKISHKPVQMAIQADSESWTFLQTPAPLQKFWGKSAELNTEGRARVFLHAHSEVYSYTLASSFLRNVIAGEKYIEPVSTMTIICESSGLKAVATFKAGGMFAGRSEEVSVQTFDNRGVLSTEGLAGKWTTHLNVTSRGQDTGNTIWRATPLAPDAPSRYGFSEFAAQMNETTSVEEDKIPITDSRLRPDQRCLELGDLDKAESLKARLEERQRQRRRVLEEHGKEWTPKWFYKSGTDGNESVWRLKVGKDGYWEQRETGKWVDVVDVFET